MPIGDHQPLKDPLAEDARIVCTSGGPPSLWDDDDMLAVREPVDPNRRPFSPLTLLRYRWMMLAVFLVGSCLTIPLVWLMHTKVFSATAQLEIRPVVQTILTPTEESGAVPFYQTYLNTQVSVIRSTNVLERVLDYADIQETEWYKGKQTSFLGSQPPTPLARLRENLKIMPINQTHIINVSFECQKPVDAQSTVNRVVQAYTQYKEETVDQDWAKRDSNLRLLEKGLSDDVNAKTRARNDFAGGRTDATLQNNEAMNSSRLLAIQTALDDAQMELRKYKDQLDRLTPRAELPTTDAAPVLVPDAAPVLVLEGGSPAGEPAIAGPPSLQDSDARIQTPEDDAAIEEDPFKYRYVDQEWLTLRRRWRDMVHEVELAEDRLGQDHPQFKEFEKRLEHARLDLEERETELATLHAEAVTADGAPIEVDPRAQIEGYLADKISEVSLLQNQLSEQERKTNEAASQFGRLVEMDQELAQARQKLEQVRDRIRTLELESKAPGRVNIVSGAILPTEPEKDRRLVFSVMLLCLWAGAGVGLAYVRFLLDGSVREQDEVTTAVRVPFLGQLPRVSAGCDLLNGLDSPVQEQLRIIRTSLLERVEGERSFAVLITSPGPQTGKTTLSVLLARSLGQLKKRVLLVDADLRRMGLSKLLGCEGSPGLVELLRGTLSQSDVVARVSRIGVDLVPAGRRVAPDDPELLANGAFHGCLKAWRERYDFIVLDASPVLPVADSRMLAGQVDGTVLTVRASQTQRKEAVESLAVLNACGGRLVGTVLNDIQPRLGRGYRYGYYGYYDDYADRSNPPAAAAT